MIFSDACMNFVSLAIPGGNLLVEKYPKKANIPGSFIVLKYSISFGKYSINFST